MAEGSQNNSSVCNHSCAEEEDPSNNVEPSIAADNSAEGSDHLRTAAHLCNEAITVLQTKVHVAGLLTEPFPINMTQSLIQSIDVL